MDKITKQETINVGSKDAPVSIYWDYKDKQTDHFLMILSISSGSYGYDKLNFDVFIDSCYLFLRYARNKNNYLAQIKFVLENAHPECAYHLFETIVDKWNIEIVYENIHETYLPA